MVEAFPSQPSGLTASNRTGDAIMRDLMLGLQVLTGASVTTSLQLLHLGFKTTQGSAPLIPVVAFYNSKDGILLFFFSFVQN